MTVPQLPLLKFDRDCAVVVEKLTMTLLLLLLLLLLSSWEVDSCNTVVVLVVFEKLAITILSLLLLLL